ncbi:hypothetical protein [Pedobacter gandavensis]|uniref:hypothetical protein n=1 Tax=Pedobacter gandavensis TaxID=2679963 RepID=UPI00292CEB7B|nr:hypothetical protein [Pedobacter gandavensis]
MAELPSQINKSPFAYVWNNSINLIDPDGRIANGLYREYRSATEYYKDNPIGKLDGSDGHWLTSDREDNTEVWNEANRVNIQKPNGYKEYENLDQRADFYRWFQSQTEAKGSETKWAGAAAETVDKLKMLLWKSSELMGYSNSEIKAFVKSGNKLILDDAWSSLQKLYNGQALKGKQAEAWDSKQLYKEQILINNSY